MFFQKDQNYSVYLKPVKRSFVDNFLKIVSKGETAILVDNLKRFWKNYGIFCKIGREDNYILFIL